MSTVKIIDAQQLTLTSCKHNMTDYFNKFQRYSGSTPIGHGVLESKPSFKGCVFAFIWGSPSTICATPGFLFIFWVFISWVIQVDPANTRGQGTREKKGMVCHQRIFLPTYVWGWEGTNNGAFFHLSETDF